jgi:hypothetical protein
MFPTFLALSLCSALPTQILHLRADSGVVLDANGRVSLWKDLSPRHTDFGTPTLGRPVLLFTTPNIDTVEKRVFDTLAGDSLLRPRLLQNGIGGLPSVYFEGANALLDTSSLPLDSGFTLFVVAQDSSGPGIQSALISKERGDICTNLWNGDNDNFALGVAWTGIIAGSNLETAAPTLYESSWDGSLGTIRANGEILSTGSWSDTIQRSKTTWLGASRIGGSSDIAPDLTGLLKGRIGEVIVYAGTLDSCTRIQVETDLATRYGLPSPPVVGCGDHSILHLRADTGVVLDEAGRVKLWKDLSPRHTDFGTPTLGRPVLLFTTPNIDTVEKRVFDTLAGDSLLRPRLLQNGIGGLPSVYFEGANALLDTSSLPLDSGFTLFVVAQDSSGPGIQSALISKERGDICTNLWNGDNDNFALGVAWTGIIAGSNLETAAPTLYESSWDGSLGTIRANGEILSTGSWSDTIQRSKTTWLGASRIGGSSDIAPDLTGLLKGRIGEVIVYAGTLANLERQDLENGLMDKFGIQRSNASVRPAMASPGFSVHIASGWMEVVAAGNGRVYATSLNGRILGQADLVSGKAELPRFRGEVLLTVRDASGSVESRLLVDPSR